MRSPRPYMEMLGMDSTRFANEFGLKKRTVDNWLCRCCMPDYVGNLIERIIAIDAKFEDSRPIFDDRFADYPLLIL